MSFNRHWPRWIELSIQKWVKDNTYFATPGDIHVFFEGQERKTNEHHTWLEVRVDGPMSREASKDYWFLESEVNILTSCSVERDISLPSKLNGLVGEVLDNNIPIYKMGDGPTDDPNVQLGCLTVDTRTDKDGVIIKKFGQIEPKVKIIQASVEVRYWMRLDA